MTDDDRLFLIDWSRMDSTKLFLDSIKEQRDVFTNDLINISFDSPNRNERMGVIQGIVRGLTYSINMIEELQDEQSK